MSIRYSSDQLQRKFPGPAGSPGYARVAEALRTEGRLDDAIALCQEGLRSRPLVAGYVVLGKSLADAGRPEEAREQFEAALRLDPRCLSAMHALARLMDKLQWPDAAAGYYRSILEVEPWDAEIRALLEGIAPGRAMPGIAPAGEGAGMGPAGTGTGGAPLGSSLADAAPIREAVAFPGAEDTFTKPEGFHGDVMEVNLNDVADEFLPSGGEDAGAALEDALSPGAAGSPADDFSPAPDPAGEPRPMDVLSSAPPSGPETLGENAPAPISGSDVEERLDSLFGNEDGNAPSATATWTAAPALPDLPPDASATATGEMRAFGTAPDLPAEASPFDLAVLPDAADEASPASRATQAGIPEGAAATGGAPFGGTEAFAEDARVQGEDIERRLDELFDLSGDDDKPKPALSASDLPIASSPVVGEAVDLGETVAFGQGPAAPAAGEAVAEPEGEIVTGQDVADKLDSLFGEEPAPKAPASAAAEARIPAEEAPPEPPANETLLSTESMMPAAWSGDAPQVTGADVEAQLDKLFDLAPSPAAPAAGTAPEAVPEAAPPGGTGTLRNLDETVTFTEPPSPAPAGEKARLKESVADWLARQEEEPSAGDTLILPSASLPAEAPAAGKAIDDPFGTLAPEDIPALSETASIEMVDGGEVADRLDKLFADAPSGAPSEIPLFAPEEPAFPDPVIEPDAGATLEVPIPKLDEAEIAPEADAASSHSLTGSGIAEAGQDGALAAAHAPEALSDGAGTASGPSAPGLSPMLDEEEGYPEEEEMPAQGAGANVATVTLAEIYFQQGLREQALQIYRQLLEREPENESVRKRIAEIEASKPEGDQGPGSDPRRPRPGLKVPKRKK